MTDSTEKEWRVTVKLVGHASGTDEDDAIKNAGQDNWSGLELVDWTANEIRKR